MAAFQLVKQDFQAVVGKGCQERRVWWESLPIQVPGGQARPSSGAGEVGQPSKTGLGQELIASAGFWHDRDGKVFMSTRRIERVPTSICELEEYQPYARDYEQQVCKIGQRN